MIRRLDATTAPAALLPSFDRRRLRPRILHIGPGAFHRAHQVPATDAANAAWGDWGIAGLSLKSDRLARALTPQDGLYTLVARDMEGCDLGLCASLLSVRGPSQEKSSSNWLDGIFLSVPLAIVSLTVTEKGYCARDRSLDLDHPDIAADLRGEAPPQSAVGLIARGLAARHRHGLPPLSIMSCDNLPANGALLRDLVLAFAAEVDDRLAAWIAAEVAFPASMVDRITPATTDALLREVTEAHGLHDAAPVVAERYSAWVIEDRFAGDRPAWERGGARIVADVAPFEAMKLRMLNGTHSLLAYAGALAGHELTRDAVADPALAALARAHLAAAAATLPPVPGVETAAYAEELLQRFANPALGHRTAQIAIDGSQKLPQRIFAPALETLQRGGSPATYSFATASWMHWIEQTGPVIDDPRAAELHAAVAGAAADDAVARFSTLADLIPSDLAAAPTWRQTVAADLAALRGGGMAATLAKRRWA
ncbi:MAG: mannitol dehydrogenase family protein [Pseudomonadota bacterium]